MWTKASDTSYLFIFLATASVISVFFICLVSPTVFYYHVFHLNAQKIWTWCFLVLLWQLTEHIWIPLMIFGDLWQIFPLFADILQIKQSWISSHTSIRSSRIKLKVFVLSNYTCVLYKSCLFWGVYSHPLSVWSTFSFSFSHWGFQSWWRTGVWIWSLPRGDFQNFILVCFGCGCLRGSTQTEHLKTARHVET